MRGDRTDSSTPPFPERMKSSLARLLIAHPDASSVPSVQSAGLLILRVFAGCSLALAHGIGKLPPSARFLAGVDEMGFPAPLVFAIAAGLSEFIGGLLLALGLLTRPATVFIAITMTVATFIRQAGDPYLERELSLLFGFVALGLMVAGPGRYSVDALLGRLLTRRP